MEAIPNRPRSSSFLRVSSLAALSFLLLSACGRPAVTSAPALTDEQLANAEYNAPTPAQGSIRLRDGVYREATGEIGLEVPLPLRSFRRSAISMATRRRCGR
jgi:hypothetical protein